jgi:hypothetical protein
VKLNGRDAVIAGVMPASMWLDTTSFGVADVWLPFGAGREMTNRRFRQFTAIGRLAPGVTIETANAELKTIADSIAQAYPKDSASWTVEGAPLKDSVTKSARSTLWILFGGVACVLLVACANIASLLLMRAAGRSREGRDPHGDRRGTRPAHQPVAHRRVRCWHSPAASAASCSRSGQCQRSSPLRRLTCPSERNHG